MESDRSCGIRLFKFFLSGISFLFDAITFIPWQFYGLRQRLNQKSILAAPISENCSEPIYRNVEVINRSLHNSMYPGCNTVTALWSLASDRFKYFNFLGTREVIDELEETQPNGAIHKKLILGDYHWLTFEEVSHNVDKIGTYIQNINPTVRHVIFFSETRAEWLTSFLGCMKYGFVVVTLYPTLGFQAICDAIEECGASIIICSYECINKLIPLSKTSQFSNISNVIYFDSALPKKAVPKVIANAKVIAFSSVLSSTNATSALFQVQPDDLLCIMYTSGSTGRAKGVLLTHKNVCASTSGMSNSIKSLTNQDVYVAFLPLAHVLELTCELICSFRGCRIGYSSPLTLTNRSGKIKAGVPGDCSQLKPTVMIAVPLVLDRVYKHVCENLEKKSKYARALFNWALEYKECTRLPTPFLDWLIFSKIYGMLGGHMRVILSGSARLSPHTQKFCTACFSCPVLQGYGLTESSGGISVADLDDYNGSNGHVGAATTAVEIKLINWGDEYQASERRGEILLSGDCITSGYYKRPDLLDDVFQVDKTGRRWFCTGDIGEISERGELKIIDRKKDMLKLATGEYIPLAKVESVLKTHSLVDNICVVGRGGADYVIAIVVLNSLELKNLGYETNDGVCANPELITYVLKEFDSLGKRRDLDKYEIPRKVVLSLEEWTSDSGLITDAFKLKRFRIEHHYSSAIKKLYGHQF